MGNDLSAISKPKPSFFENGTQMSLVASKSNWFENEYFTGVLNITCTTYIPPIYCDVLIDCCEYVHWTE